MKFSLRFYILWGLLFQYSIAIPAEHPNFNVNQFLSSQTPSGSASRQRYNPPTGPQDSSTNPYPHTQFPPSTVPGTNGQPNARLTLPAPWDTRSPLSNSRPQGPSFAGPTGPNDNLDFRGSRAGEHEPNHGNSITTGNPSHLSLHPSGSAGRDQGPVHKPGKAAVHEAGPQRPHPEAAANPEEPHRPNSPAPPDFIHFDPQPQPRPRPRPRRFTCQFPNCGESYNSSHGDLLRHVITKRHITINKKHGKQIFRCNHCKRHMTDKWRTMKRHLRQDPFCPKDSSQSSQASGPGPPGPGTM